MPSPRPDRTRISSLIAQAQQGNEVARNKVIEQHMFLVRSVVRSFVDVRDPRKDDLTQEGSIGLFKALERFDAGRGVQFGTYAVWWIRAKIRRYLNHQQQPEGMLSLNYRGLDDDEEFGAQLAAEAPDLVNELGDDDLRTTVRGIAETVARRLDRTSSRRAKSNPHPHLIILRGRWLAVDPQMLQEVGTVLKCSRERVRQIETTLLQNLADVFHAQDLNSLLEAS